MLIKLFFRMIYSIPFFMVIGIGVLLWQGLKEDPKRLPSTLINKEVPGFSLPSLNKSQQSFTHRDLKGQVSLLHVWASWCGTCKEEQSVLNKIANTRQVTLYGIDYKDKREDAQAWLKSQNPYKKVGFDKEGKVSINWGVYGTPTTYLIDSKGIVRYRYVGAMTWEIWNAEFLPIIQGFR